MLSQRVKNLLPKRLTDRVALKTLISQHLLLRSGGFRKQTRFTVFSKTSKVTFGVLFLLYFSGYQPTLAIPPIKQSVARAEFSQEQNISSTTLPQAFILPHPGYLSTRFSNYHPGIDIATGLGMPIHPIADGLVIDVTYGFLGLGHAVTMEHAGGFKSVYGHMGEIYVKNGDTVTQGSTLGEVGLTGHTTGPHTHLEVTKNGQYIDPLLILPALQNWPESAGAAPQGEGITRSLITPTPTPAREVTKAEDKNLSFLKNLQSPSKQSPLLPPSLAQF
jgi:murein DD-endopeptidase MepM/ murein hydrolase activator NlpD